MFSTAAIITWARRRISISAPLDGRSGARVRRQAARTRHGFSSSGRKTGARGRVTRVIDYLIGRVGKRDPETATTPSGRCWRRQARYRITFNQESTESAARAAARRDRRVARDRTQTLISKKKTPANIVQWRRRRRSRGKPQTTGSARRFPLSIAATSHAAPQHHGAVFIAGPATVSVDRDADAVPVPGSRAEQLARCMRSVARRRHRPRRDGDTSGRA